MRIYAAVRFTIYAAVRFTINTTDPTTGTNVAPHVLLKTSLGDIHAFADGRYNGPAFNTIAIQIYPQGAGRRLLQSWLEALQGRRG